MFGISFGVLFAFILVGILFLLFWCVCVRLFYCLFEAKDIHIGFPYGPHDWDM